MVKDPTRKKHMTRLSKLVNPMIEPSVRARGFILSRLISEWPQIMGDMATWCQPAELKFAAGDTANGTLKLAIASGRGPEASQQTAIIINRVNAAFGYAAVSRISFSQTLHGGVPSEATPGGQSLENFGQETTLAGPQQNQDKTRNERIWTLDEKLQTVKSPEVRAALRRFGTPIDAPEK